MYKKIKFNKIGVEDSLSETTLDMDQLVIINFSIISIHNSTINWKTEFVKDAMIYSLDLSLNHTFH